MYGILHDIVLEIKSQLLRHPTASIHRQTLSHLTLACNILVLYTSTHREHNSQLNTHTMGLKRDSFGRNYTLQVGVQARFFYCCEVALSVQ